MELVADRAGISRATSYQQSKSRLELVDAICDTFGTNPALLELRQIVELPDAQAAMDGTIARSVRFWSSEDGVLRQIYGVAAIDPAAQGLVQRRRADRRSELERLVGSVQRAGRLRDGPTTSALAVLLVLTSYETFRALREAGLSDPEVIATLQQAARDLLLT